MRLWWGNTLHIKLKQKFRDLELAKFCSSLLQEYPKAIKSAVLNQTHFPQCLYIKLDFQDVPNKYYQILHLNKDVIP
jgi:hypothetical protein